MCSSSCRISHLSRWTRPRLAGPRMRCSCTGRAGSARRRRGEEAHAHLEVVSAVHVGAESYDPRCGRRLSHGHRVSQLRLRNRSRTSAGQASRDDREKPQGRSGISDPPERHLEPQFSQSLPVDRRQGECEQTEISDRESAGRHQEEHRRGQSQVRPRRGGRGALEAGGSIGALAAPIVIERKTPTTDPGRARIPFPAHQERRPAPAAARGPPGHRADP